MNLNLPQIVVVGSQSCGKSSVLENLVGRDFLPRGTGIVTRVPLELQLIHVPPIEERQSSSSLPDCEEWAEFLHRPGEIFKNFDMVRREIERQTNVLVGDQKNVANKPINLKIFSPHVLDLSLVDLPGITKVAVADQPHDIEAQIRELVLLYITKTNALILAVSPANSDIANSDSLKIAREVDPEGDRTIGVVTKLDLMDKGTDAMNVLNGKLICLKHGMIGVVNRSQLDIDKKKDINAAIRSEDAFFTDNYPTIKDRCGTKFLASTLNKLLMAHIRECLPGLQDRIKKAEMNYKKFLDDLGEDMFEEDKRGAILLQFLTNFAAAFSSSIDGGSVPTATTSSFPSDANHLNGGAKIGRIFRTKFAQMLRNMEALDGLSTNDIQAAIRNATGTRRSLFVPEMAFEILVRRQIHRLLDPAMKCIEMVFQELESLIDQCAQQELNRVRILRARTQGIATDLLRSKMPETNRMIESLILIEEAYINTNHPHFGGATGAYTKMMARLNPGPNPPEGENAAPASSAPNTYAPPYPTTAHHSEKSAPHSDPPGSPDRNSVVASQKGLWLWPFGRGSQTEGYQTPLKSFTSEDYAGAASTTPPTVDRKAYFASSLNDHEQVEVDLITNLIESYYNIVRDKILDSIPKAIMHFLVNDVKSNMQSELVTKLWKTEMFAELLQEDPMAATQRENAKEMLKALRKASAIVDDSMFNYSRT